jgi:proposed homoserine kinase
MKYFVLICDGMADLPIPSLNNMTPMEAAEKSAMDALCKKSVCGMMSNVPDGMVPESDTANLAVLSYDPRVYSKGRSPLEAVSMGITLNENDTAIRCNLVTLSDDGEYDEKLMIDHSADEITTEEADELIKALNEHLSHNGENWRLHTGVSYRHCLIWENISDTYAFMRPHDILDCPIKEYLPTETKGTDGDKFYKFMRDSWDILRDHPVNMSRRSRGLKPANSAWLWSPGKKPALPSFEKKWGVKGSVISAVDLIKGIGLCAEMDVINVQGATGNFHTNYAGKAQAATTAFGDGSDFVFLHVEAPDECGHRGEIENKVKSIELIDAQILAPVHEYLKNCGDDYKIAVLPDHPTPLALRTHTADPVPFIIYSSSDEKSGIEKFTEKECERTGLYISDGSTFLEHIIA